MEETGGCTCEQIIVALELGQGHVKFGCSISAMQDWIALVESGDAAGRYARFVGTETPQLTREDGGMACNASGDRNAPLWGFLFASLLLWTHRRKRRA